MRMSLGPSVKNKILIFRFTLSERDSLEGSCPGHCFHMGCLKAGAEMGRPVGLSLVWPWYHPRQGWWTTNGCKGGSVKWQALGVRWDTAPCVGPSCDLKAILLWRPKMSLQLQLSTILSTSASPWELKFCHPPLHFSPSLTRSHYYFSFPLP
jgi:hypothetical protein